MAWTSTSPSCCVADHLTTALLFQLTNDMSSPAAITFLKTDELSREELAAKIGDLDNARLSSPTGGEVGKLECELRHNPDRDTATDNVSSWLRYPLTIEFYETERCGSSTDAVAAIDQVLNILGTVGASYVTSSDLEDALSSQGRNRPLDDE